MRQPQFGLRVLFAIVSLTAIVFAIANFQMEFFPQSAVAVVALTGVIAVVAIGFGFFGALMGLTVFLSEDDGNRKHNLRKCRNMVLLGLLGTSPFLFVISVYLMKFFSK